MLHSLHVKNLALIEEEEVVFGPGLNILTGETGAGKSIVIGSIAVALGARIPKEMIRDNTDTALVELVFHIQDQKQLEALARYEIYPEDGFVILGRKIVNGRSICRINAETVPASRMQEAASVLIDIYGQQEHQSLTNKKKQMDILDEYAKQKIKGEKAELRQNYQLFRSLESELKTADIGDEERRRELSFLLFEVEEIENASLLEGEDITLEQTYRKLTNGQKIKQALSLAYEQTGDSSGNSDNASDLITHAVREISGISKYDDKIMNLETQLLEIDSLLNDFNREISSYLEESEFSEEQFLKIQSRLDEINRLKSKYGRTLEDIDANLKEKKTKIEKLENHDLYLTDLRKRVLEMEGKVKESCSKISAIRSDAAQELSAKIADALRDLNFLSVDFEICLHPLENLTANGSDEIEFLISLNPGEHKKSLEKVASGGELSRIMLALKSILADTDDIGTLIFDEIDTGISGRTAQMVSEKMNQLSYGHQLLCITHLPQIAAMADEHFLIEKKVENNSTTTKITNLEHDAHIRELARMLGGVEITETVLKNAEEMRHLALEKKKRT